ncbi:hypothetical protein XBKQ1_380001 [Xenorhabdus bovienii str. kraussei Quebec]|uniref:AbiTii domain-containing protein n=1 Tax=Xenorhabdus bovienii str. kraussei Quebec TaxID=1398203 RepID=A0A077PL71_XENBV|nr:hypothetical protein [Xenorhabdus bovienii]CDH21357.1 hypothetical protein XBKQ1_380001 [Xenorhabdus bovienii str. kraussei Quebec]
MVGRDYCYQYGKVFILLRQFKRELDTTEKGFCNIATFTPVIRYYLVVRNNKIGTTIMSGLVLELQRDALNKNISVSDLLRKTLVVSKKLNIVEIETWVKNELYGYSSSEEAIPSYREIRGELAVFNPYHGLQPLYIRDVKLAEILSTREMGQSVGELDALLIDNKGKTLHVPFNQNTKNQLIKLMNVPLEPTLLVSHTEIVGILDAIRNEVLYWVLDLESREILGDRMSFTKEEKQAAAQVTYQITNNIQNMNNSQLQQDSAGANQSLVIYDTPKDFGVFIEQFKKIHEKLELDELQRRELNAEVSTMELQLKSPNPKQMCEHRGTLSYLNYQAILSF